MSGRRSAGGGGQVAITVFGATWVPPWQVLDKQLDDVVAAGVPVTRVDVDEDPGAAERRHIICVPTVVITRAGEERHRIVGSTSATDILAAVQRLR